MVRKKKRAGTLWVVIGLVLTIAILGHSGLLSIGNISYPHQAPTSEIKKMTKGRRTHDEFYMRLKNI